MMPGWISEKTRVKVSAAWASRFGMGKSQFLRERNDLTMGAAQASDQIRGQRK
jgi:hypothetical protein